MKRTMLCLMLCVLATGCKEGWTSENKQQYLQAREDSPNASGLSPAQRKAYCACSLEEVMKHYSNVEEVLINKDSLVVNQAMLECRSKAMQ